MKQNAIGWFDIYVTDMSRAVTFYQTVLHCELGVIEDPTDSGALMKSFTADMSVYGAGGALVQDEESRQTMSVPFLRSLAERISSGSSAPSLSSR